METERANGMDWGRWIEGGRKSKKTRPRKKVKNGYRDESPREEDKKRDRGGGGEEGRGMRKKKKERKTVVSSFPVSDEGTRERRMRGAS